MVKYSYPFNFDFDYDLLLEDANKLSEFQVLQERTGSGNNYKKAEEGDNITLRAHKLSLYKTPSIKNNPNTLSIVAQCKKLFDAIGSKDNDILLLEYDENCFLGWHIDNPPEAYTESSIRDELIEHCYQDKYITTHEYKTGDLILYDNMRMCHRRDGTVNGKKQLLRFALNNVTFN